MTTPDELGRLRFLRQSGYITPAELERLQQLEGPQVAQPSASVAPVMPVPVPAVLPQPVLAARPPWESDPTLGGLYPTPQQAAPRPPAVPPIPAYVPPVPPTTPASDGFIPVNTDEFEKGWGASYLAPATPGVKDAVYTGYFFPNRNPDQCWFTFESLSDAPEQFRGSLVTAALTKPSAQGIYGAGKLKDTIDAIGLRYEVISGRGIRVEPGTGHLCKVSWEWVDVRGKQELRIQNVYPASFKVESLT